jgi:hypothetical protein
MPCPKTDPDKSFESEQPNYDTRYANALWNIHNYFTGIFNLIVLLWRCLLSLVDPSDLDDVRREISTELSNIWNTLQFGTAPFELHQSGAPTVPLPATISPQIEALHRALGKSYPKALEKALQQVESSILASSPNT